VTHETAGLAQNAGWAEGSGVCDAGAEVEGEREEILAINL